MVLILTSVTNPARQNPKRHIICTSKNCENISYELCTKSEKFGKIHENVFGIFRLLTKVFRTLKTDFSDLHFIDSK